MRDEEYLFHSDVREKKVTGYSARKQRSHCGKAGCKLPSDYLTKKELKNMSGECKTYRLNSPMKWEEFKEMPDEHQETYLKLLRQKYNVSDNQIAKMLGVAQTTLYSHLKKKGLNRSGAYAGSAEWDKEGFYTWAYGIPKMEDRQSVQDEAEQEPEIAEEIPVIEEDLPWDAPEEEVPASEPVTLTSLMAVPESGSMTFTGDATQIMNTLVNLFGGANIKINVHWDVVED